MPVIVTYEEFVRIALNAMEDLVESGVAELTEQGHVDTGEGVRSLEVEILEKGKEKLRLAIKGNDYLLDLDQGVPPDKVDLSAEAEQKMLAWAARRRPALSDSNRRRFVFLVMNKAAIVGYPLDGAYLYTKNGRRTGWIDAGIEKNVEQIFEVQYAIFELLGNNFEGLMQSLIDDAKKV